MSRKATIVLIHSWWLTPLVWEPFRRFYGNLGYPVLAPAWPGVAGSVAELRHDASALNGLGAREVTAHYAKLIRGLPAPPVIMGHGFGGLITQLLLDQGLGAAGIAIGSIPPKGLLLGSLWSRLAWLGMLARSSDRSGTFRPSLRQFQRWIGNTLPAAEARKMYEAQIIPTPSRAILQAALANVTPGARSTAVNFKNPHRSPLLFIGGGADRWVPASLSRRQARQHRASPGLSDYQEFPCRSHALIVEPGWQEVADHALTWALTHARRRSS